MIVLSKKDYENPRLPIKIGAYTYGEPIIRGRFNNNKVQIGRFCSIGPNVKFFVHNGNHRASFISTYPFFDPDFGLVSSMEYENSEVAQIRLDDLYPSKGDIVIGNDVWIGEDSIIFAGVTIGDGAIIGAGSVVRKDVPPYAIIKGEVSSGYTYRFSDEQIEKLLKIKWWDWDIEEIQDNMILLSSKNIDDFLSLHTI